MPSHTGESPQSEGGLVYDFDSETYIPIPAELTDEFIIRLLPLNRTMVGGGPERNLYRVYRAMGLSILDAMKKAVGPLPGGPT